MTTAIEWIRHALQSHPELALFLALAAGHSLGRLQIKSFKLGAVVGCLLMGVVIGQFGIKVPGVLGRTFFLLFLFSVGYKTGPQFFRSFGKGAIRQLVLTLFFSTTGFLVAYAVARVFDFDAGIAAGLLAGGLHTSEAVGTAADAVGRLSIPDDLKQTLTANITVGYAVTYLVAIFTGIFSLTRLGPWIMRIDLRAECQKLEQELGMKRDEPGVVSAYRHFVVRAYSVPNNWHNKTVVELENAFSPERVFVERVKTGQGVIDAESNLQLHVGDRIVLSGRPAMLAGLNNPFHPHEVEEPELLDVPAMTVDYILERKDLLHRTLDEIVETLEHEVPTRGVYLRRVLRSGEELPLGSKVVLERGDVLTLVGSKRHVERLAAQLGPVERRSYATDLVSLCLAIVIGGFIGLPAIHLTRISIAIGIPVGVLLGSLVVGWLHARRPGLGKVPEPVVWFLDSFGLSAFTAGIGINAGPGFVQGVRSTGLELFICGLFISAIPYIATILLGRYVFRMNPAILLGVCAGSGTSSPALAALQEKAESRVPVLGYGVSYALAAVLTALWGSVIVALVYRS
jgi:putative transport protein